MGLLRVGGRLELSKINGVDSGDLCDAMANESMNLVSDELSLKIDHLNPLQIDHIRILGIGLELACNGG